MSDPAPFRIEDLRADLRMIASGPGQAYLLRTPAGVVLVDTGSRWRRRHQPRARTVTTGAEHP
jgi:hypothetical protein